MHGSLQRNAIRQRTMRLDLRDHGIKPRTHPVRAPARTHQQVGNRLHQRLVEAHKITLLPVDVQEVDLPRQFQIIKFRLGDVRHKLLKLCESLGAVPWILRGHPAQALLLHQQAIAKHFGKLLL